MEQVRSLIQERFWNIIMLFVIGGFLMTAAELVFIGHVNGSQLVAVYASIFGALLAIHGLMVTGKTRYYLAGIFLLLCLMGLIGVFEHFGTRRAEEAMALMQQMTSTTTGNVAILSSNNSTNSWFVRITSPPILAPLSLSGLSLLGMFTLFVRSESESATDKI